MPHRGRKTAPGGLAAARSTSCQLRGARPTSGQGQRLPVPPTPTLAPPVPAARPLALLPLLTPTPAVVLLDTPLLFTAAPLRDAPDAEVPPTPADRPVFALTPAVP